jgi:hypothetical protein
MKNQTAEFQLDLRTSEADAAFAQTSQLKPESFKSGFKFLIGEATKLFSTPTRRKIMTQEKQNSSVETSVAFTNTHAAKDSALRGSLKRGRNHLSVAALVMLLPNFLNATCIPSAPAGYTVPFSMVTLKNNQHAYYATGLLTISVSNDPYEQFTTLSATEIPELFSDRFVPVTCRPGALCGPGDQPFDINQADKLGVTITETALRLSSPATINVTFTLESWGNGTESFSGSCDATTGELYGTFDGVNFAVIAFGTPEAPIGPPK